MNRTNDLPPLALIGMLVFIGFLLTWVWTGAWQWGLAGAGLLMALTIAGAVFDDDTGDRG